MAFEQKPNSGALFKNERKNSEKQPDFTGTIDIEGEQFKLAGWSRVSKKGTKFISLSVKTDKRERANDDDIF
jgi:uncharacterized protein (DUF736 family)